MVPFPEWNDLNAPFAEDETILLVLGDDRPLGQRTGLHRFQQALDFSVLGFVCEPSARLNGICHIVALAYDEVTFPVRIEVADVARFSPEGQIDHVFEPCAVVGNSPRGRLQESSDAIFLFRPMPNAYLGEWK